jgi:S-adenosylmethionine:tRNA ribosyltransferase-isomerase
MSDQNITSLFSLAAYQYELPKELIAQKPVEPRDSSRLMVINRNDSSIEIMKFGDLSDLLKCGDSFVFNDTRVIPARLLGRRLTGGAAEVFLLKERSLGIWEALVRPGKKVRFGEQVIFGDSFSCKVIEVMPNGNRLVQFSWEGEFSALLEKYGHVPLPQYIERNDLPEDRERFQTIYAANPGAVAAPTAGLHFTEGLLARCIAKGVCQNTLTLHVGVGTFRPVQTADIREHQMHTEPFWITDRTASLLNSRSPCSRQICVGTTSCRALESASTSEGIIVPGSYETSIFIHPGYQFKYVQALLTNFHLPGSSLLMLVAAFGGYDLVMGAYARAIEEKFRFYSYGDAMLIL